jgi:hypothetical protein
MKLEAIQARLGDKDTKRVAQVAAQKMTNGDGGCSTPSEACRQTFRMRRTSPTREQLVAAVHLLEAGLPHQGECS